MNERVLPWLLLARRVQDNGNLKEEKVECRTRRRPQPKSLFSLLLLLYKIILILDVIDALNFLF